MLISRDTMVTALSRRLDGLLAAQLIDELISLERRYIQRDWEPAELDGGQFCEILGRILYHLDSGNPSPDKKLEDCLKYLRNEHVPHALTPRSEPLLIARVIDAIYKVRSARGAVHISSSYGPNQMDAKLVIECVRWMAAETLRTFWDGDRDRVATAIRELLEFDVPCIGEFEGLLLVQRTDLTTEEEILLLLHYAGDRGFTRAQLGQHLRGRPSSTVSDALGRLVALGLRQVIALPSGPYRLTDLGAKRVREDLSSRLVLQ